MYENYINGKWQSSVSGETISSFNPAYTSELVGQVQSSTIEDLDVAVEAARKATKIWRNTSSIQRGNLLHRAADILENKKEDIAVTATKEMGKTLVETKAEVDRSVAILRFFAQEGWRKTGDIIPSQDSNNLLYS